MGNYKKIAARFFNQPWAISYEKLQELMGFMEIKMNGGTISDETIQAAISGNQRLEERKAGAVAILPISGILRFIKKPISFNTIRQSISFFHHS